MKKLIIVFTAILLSLISCYTDDPNIIKKPDTHTISSDEFSYKEAWEKVYKHYNKGLPKSALKEVVKIYKIAKEEENEGQQVKALIHRIHYLQQVEEETLVKINKQLQAELNESKHPVKPLLHSMIAEQYWNYYQRNRYRFLRRTKTTKFDQYDMRTWSLNKIVEEVVFHYKKSLENVKNLKTTKIEVFDEIIYKGYSSRKYRPTLYDFLAHRAIDFFMNTEAGLTKPVYQFTLNNSKYFLINKDFANLKIKTKDQLSFHFYAIKILQSMVNFHLNDKNPEALIDADLKRLRFVYNKAIIDNKEKIYENVLRKMAAKFQSSPIAAEIYYEIANLYYNLGSKYKPNPNDQYKWFKKKAYNLCNETIKKYPKSIGARNCQALITSIEKKSLQITTEKTTIPGKPFRGLINYQNINKLYFKIVKTTRKELNTQKRYSTRNLIDFYNKKKPVLNWQQIIPDDKDYQPHLTEIKINKLKPGKFILLTANSENFNHSKNAVAYNEIDVTNIAYIQRNNNKNGLEFNCLHRETGLPLKDCKAQVWYQKWNKSKRKYFFVKGKLYKANSKGYFNIEKNSVTRNSFNLEFILGNDKYYDTRSYYIYGPYNRFSKRTTTFFFADRAIYRPGQTVYFKGIKLFKDTKDGEKNKVIKNSSAYLTLYDVNYQKVSTLRLKTNEYGTFSGSFKLPTGVLNGQMRITDGYGNLYFSVEEYKRPKFEVTFQPLKKTYRVNDSVLVKGNAKGFAGYNIDNALVKYRVVRKVFYPYRWYYWSYFPGTPQMEILNGVTKTNAKGEFSVKFKAIPDLTTSKKNKPAFTYEISVDITDLNGETRSSQKSVSVGYTALKLNVNFTKMLDKADKQYAYSINSTNLSGDFVGARGKIVIYRLKAPGKIFRKRLWQKPDKFTLTKKNYYKNFTRDQYSDEENITKWKKIKSVYNRKFNTTKNKNFKIRNLIKWKAGKYLIELTSKDKFGNIVKELKYFTLYSRNEKKLPYKQLDWFAVSKGKAEPGENAVFVIGSSDKNVRVLYETEYRGNIVKQKIFTLNNEQRKIVVPIKEKHRGNLGVIFTFLKHNRVFTKQHNIYVPWSNKDLKLSFQTFRNKLLPGQKEEWRIKIKGKKSDKLAAEMVATLYDASLDTFRTNNWYFNIFPSHSVRNLWQKNQSFDKNYSQLTGVLSKYGSYSYKSYDRLNWFGFYWRRFYRRYRNGGKYRSKSAPMSMAMNGDDYAESSVELKEEAPSKAKKSSRESEKNKDKADKGTSKAKQGSLANVKARTNFNETAFFYPHLKTNKEGEVIVAFTIPEALTKWKMLGFAHTKNLEYGFLNNELVTQKDLMVIPNAPRFLREKDTIVFTSKITNLTKRQLKGQAALLLFDSITMKPVDYEFKNFKTKKTFKTKAGQSTLISWKIKIPDDLDAVTYRVVAQAGKFSDGEEKPLPILKNRMLVTETMPLPVRSKQTKTFKFNKLINSHKSKTLKHHKLTLEFTSNPAWYAVQALPYIMEYPYECMEQTFSRYYANSIASHIVNSDPKIKRVYDSWRKTKSSNALVSNLEKNQELKSLLLQETPWVMNANNETERKRRIAFLFDINRMNDELGRALKKLSDGQKYSGAWPWFNGMRDSRYITQHIISGFAHLDALKVVKVRNKKIVWNMVKKAIPYLDRQIKEDYDYLVRKNINLKRNNLSYIQIHYLYARSYFQDIAIPSSSKKAFKYYKGQAKKYWLRNSRYMQGMIALFLNRYKEKDTALSIVKSIKEHALYSEEMGMYWKDSYGYYWYQAPIETHALMIEMFHEVAKDNKSVDDLKTWLLKQKQTQDWRTTKATVEACYALLLQGDDWLANNKLADITLGNLKIDPTKMENVKVEEGTGYFKTSWSKNEIKPEMGNVIVKNKNSVVAWGGLYWQYFEDLDKITPHETPLKLKKKLFVEKSSASGPVLVPIKKSKVKIGDRIKVRIELRVDRTMEYVHMKDMRASSFEPENVISRYKYQDGLGYYESTKDASTNFFIDYLPKGTYVFEYPLRVTHKGDFSNGITTIQCMYAPEFTSHSKGVRVQVK